MALKRSKPLKRTGGPKRTEMKRGSSELKRTTRVKPRSAKTAKVYRDERIPMYDEVRQHQKLCAWPGCRREWVDLHEVLTRGRAGSKLTGEGSITDRANVVGLCRKHNGEAQDETRQAECLGVIIPSWGGGDRLTRSLVAASVLRARHEESDAPPCPWRRNGESCTSPNDGQRSRCDAGDPPTLLLD